MLVTREPTSLLPAQRTLKLRDRSKHLNGAVHVAGVAQILQTSLVFEYYTICVSPSDSSRVSLSLSLSFSMLDHT
jgi:hypothetical protein